LPWPLLFLAAPVLYVPFVDASGLVLTLALAAFAVWTARSVFGIRGHENAAIGRAVGALIAGISLVDALLCAGSGAATAALLASAGLAATLALHRLVAGT
jgi:4-hydroxybenzoate polyprenyltransferase